MKREEIISKLKEMFIERFGVGAEVDVNKRISIDYSWDVGATYLTKVRYNGEKFEYYKSCWSGVWEDKQSVFNKYGITALSACLGVNVRTRTEYFIDD